MKFGWLVNVGIIGCLPLVSAQPLRTLTRAADIRALPPEEAARGYPVVLQGVVTDSVPSPDFFIQDKSAGIYVEGERKHRYEHQIRDLVEVVGKTGPGKYAPVVREISTQVLQHRVSMPPARVFNYSELASGRMDSQWIQIRGIIRAASIDRVSWPEPTIALVVDSGQGQFRARVPMGPGLNLALRIGSEALFEGVCGSSFNLGRQLTGVLLYVPALSFVHLESRPRTVGIPGLLQFSLTADSTQVRVQGTVTLAESSGLFFIQSGKRGLRVLGEGNPPLSVGDTVEVLGWPTIGESAPVLTSSSVRILSHGPPPAPVDFAFGDDWQMQDGALVSVEGKLLSSWAEGGERVLQVRHNETMFRAVLRGAATATVLPGRLPAVGSQVHLTGVCLVRNGGMWRIPQSFQVMLRSTSDIRVLTAPPFWNLALTRMALQVTGCALVAALTWTFILRRRLRSQMRLLRERLQRSAILEERNRIARELHDTLEQDLAAITLHLDVAADCFSAAPEQARMALHTARQVSRRSMVEARRSVWDLRSHLLESGSLATALERATAPMAKLGSVRLHFETHGDPVRLEPAVEMNLLRIGQETITNAYRHSGATAINACLTYEAQRLTLLVSDNGCGFDHQAAILASGGHFGLIDIRERARLLGARLTVRSEPGFGTSVVVEVAIGNAPAEHEYLQVNTNSGR